MVTMILQHYLLVVIKATSPIQTPTDVVCNLLSTKLTVTT